MSKPFSYNDENFTVINNMLFIHIEFIAPYTAGDSIISVPPEIAKRILYKNIFIGVVIQNVKTAGYVVFTLENGKLITSGSYGNIGKVVFSGITLLKDI